jgi:hypothetical protein
VLRGLPTALFLPGQISDAGKYAAFRIQGLLAARGGQMLLAFAEGRKYTYSKYIILIANYIAFVVTDGVTAGYIASVRATTRGLPPAMSMATTIL